MMETLPGSNGATVGGGDMWNTGVWKLLPLYTFVPCDLRHTITSIQYRCISGEMGAHMCNLPYVNI